MTTDPKSKRLSLKQYFTSARGVATAIAAFAFPLASKVIGSEANIYVFPPLGDIEGIARIGLVALCLGLSIGVYFLVVVRPIQSPMRLIWLALLIAVVSLLTYLAAYQRFVRRIEVPSRQTTVFVTVGYERSPHALQTFQSGSDYDMLRARGTSDEEVSQLWTENSLTIARLTLFLSCAITTLALLFLFSFGLMHDISQEENNNTKTEES